MLSPRATLTRPGGALICCICQGAADLNPRKACWRIIWPEEQVGAQRQQAACAAGGECCVSVSCGNPTVGESCVCPLSFPSRFPSPKGLHQQHPAQGSDSRQVFTTHPPDASRSRPDAIAPRDTHWGSGARGGYQRRTAAGESPLARARRISTWIQKPSACALSLSPLPSASLSPTNRRLLHCSSPRSPLTWSV